jgi:prepilin-type N-terminal cleavage/methylation domain-containing protein
MFTATPRHDRSAAKQRGFTLAEVLVATAVFALIFIATLLIYDRSNRVFSAGSQASDLQQNTRVAYEKLVSDVRLAGFDYKRGGIPTNAVPQWLSITPYGLGAVVVPATANGFLYRCTTPGISGNAPPTWNTGAGSTTNDGTVVWTQFGATGVSFDQPDEQIEYAWHSAITIRGNYDYDADDDTSHYEHGRERNLESVQFPIVTTGNHEIVTYALVSDKPGAANSDSVTFYADVNSGGSPSRRAYPGGAAERLITISGVDLSNANPPYTLNRYTLSDRGEVVATPLADNIRSLTFSYFQDAQARQPLTDIADPPAAINDVGGGDQYDPAHPDAVLNNRVIRRKIRAVNVQLVGMNAVADPNFQQTTTAANGTVTDTVTDTIAPNFRQFTLQSTIVPRNLGITGLRNGSSNPPPAPTIASVCYGYCGIAVVSWTPGPGGIDAVYDVMYDTSATGPFTSVLPAGTSTTYAVDLTQLDMTKHYYFKVMAKNNVGSTASTNVVGVDILNATKPNVPTSISTTGSTTGAAKISIGWTSPVSSASGAPSCTPTGTTPLYQTLGAELKGFRVYRSTSSASFTPAPSDLVLDEDGKNASGVAVSPTPVSNGAGGWFWDDTSILYCTDYYYKVQAVEWCAANGNLNTTTLAATGISDAAPPASNVAVRATTTAVPIAPAALTVDPSTSCSFGLNKCYPVTLTWQKVTKDTNGNTITIDKYNIYRLQKKNGVAYPSGATPTLAGTLTGQAILPAPVTWSEPLASNLAEHDPADNVAFAYDYYVTAVSCAEGAQSNTVTAPNNCLVGGSFTAPGSAGGDGVNTPYQSPTSVVYTPAAGKTPSSVLVSVDGATVTSVSSPYSLAWTDVADGQIHTLEWIITVGTCTQHFSMTIQNDPPTCSLRTGISIVTANTAGSNLQLDVLLTNQLTTQLLNIQSIDVSWNEPSQSASNKLSWDNLGFPSGGKLTATGTGDVARSVTFTLNPLPGTLSTSDAVIPANGSLRVSLLFSKKNGNPSPSTTAITSMTIHYKRPDTGTFLLNCQVLP